MTNSAKAKAEAAKNYSAEQEAAIKAAAPLNLEKAKALAEEFGKSWRSVVAKALSMEVEYISQPKPTKKPHQTTKAELVSAIEERLNTNLSGLEKATGRALANLVEALPE